MEVWREELYHHGILGQKWGVRRYQNSDGTLTAAGKVRAAKQENREQKKRDRATEKAAHKAYDSYSRYEDDKKRFSKLEVKDQKRQAKINAMKDRASRLSNEKARERAEQKVEKKQVAFDKKTIKQAAKLIEKGLKNEKALQQSVKTIRDQISKDGKDRVNQILTDAAIRNATIEYYDGAYYMRQINSDRLSSNIEVNKYLTKDRK